MLSPDQTQKVISYLFRSVEGQAPRETYAILDAARDDSIYQKIAPLDTEDFCLYRGDKAIELATVAPYLLNLKREDSFTEWLFVSGWGKSWGIFLQSSAPFKELHRHFRKFLMVYDEEGTPLYFRYYDPRVLRVYLPTCNESELQILFDPVIHYYVEGKEINQLIKFSCTEKFQLVQQVIQL
jgi:hypothetical protein